MGHGITCQCSRNKSSRTRRIARFHVATRMSKTPRERSAIDDETFVQRSLSNFARCLALWMVTQDAPEPLNLGAARGEPDRVAASNAPCLRPAKEQPQSARDGLRVPSTGCAVPCVFQQAHASHDSGSHDRWSKQCSVPSCLANRRKLEHPDTEVRALPLQRSPKE